MSRRTAHDVTRTGMLVRCVPKALMESSSRLLEYERVAWAEMAASEPAKTLRSVRKSGLAPGSLAGLPPLLGV